MFCSAFQLLGENVTVSKEIVRALEEFVCTLYRQKDCSDINEVRYPMFSKANLEENAMPPNRYALYKNIQCAKLSTALRYSISHGTCSTKHS